MPNENQENPIIAEKDDSIQISNICVFKMLKDKKMVFKKIGKKLIIEMYD